MTDKRHCDGPDCMVSQIVGEHMRNWIIVYQGNGIYKTLTEGSIELHFHQEACLANWSNKKVKNAT